MLPGRAGRARSHTHSTTTTISCPQHTRAQQEGSSPYTPTPSTHARTHACTPLRYSDACAVAAPGGFPGAAGELLPFCSRAAIMVRAAGAGLHGPGGLPPSFPPLPLVPSRSACVSLRLVERLGSRIHSSVRGRPLPPHACWAGTEPRVWVRIGQGRRTVLGSLLQPRASACPRPPAGPAKSSCGSVTVGQRLRRRGFVRFESLGSCFKGCEGLGSVLA